MADDQQQQQQQQQKLFRLPGTIEEEECNEQNHQLRESRAESPLLSPKNNNTIGIMPRNVTLLRVSTQSSSIAGIARQDSTRSRFRAGPARKLRRRAVLKSGECNVLQSKISRRSLRFLQDIFTTLVDTQWRWTLLCFAMSFLLSWMVFAGIWWLIAFTHGDFDPRHIADDNWRPCVVELHSFTSCFLFSIETQHTIGYGGRATTEECPEAIFVMCIQSISGVMIQAFMVGIVFAKMTRPKQRTQTLLFSRNAVICQRDGELCMMFRVGDMRKSHIIGATVRSQLIRSRTTKEGEILPHNLQELTVGADGQENSLFFIWPCTVVHRINSESPFFNLSAEDMLAERFEIVVILEGTIESTGQTTQARSSYLPQEVLWGHRFEPMVSYSKERQGYEVDYSLFNSTVQVDTPLCSGRELAEFYRMQDELRHQTSPDGVGMLRKIPSGNLDNSTGLVLPLTGQTMLNQQINSTKLHIDIPPIDQSYLVDDEPFPGPDLTHHNRYPTTLCRHYHNNNNHQQHHLSLEEMIANPIRCNAQLRNSYNRIVRDHLAIEMGEDEEMTLLNNNVMKKVKKTKSRYDLSDSRKTICCNHQLLRVQTIEGSSSYPNLGRPKSVANHKQRRHTASKERLRNLRAAADSIRKSERNLRVPLEPKVEDIKNSVSSGNSSSSSSSYEGETISNVPQLIYTTV